MDYEYAFKGRKIRQAIHLVLEACNLIISNKRMAELCMPFLSRCPCRITQQQTLCSLFLLILYTRWTYGDINCRQI